jgi:hypothetical protein
MKYDDYDFNLTNRNSYQYIDPNDMNIKQILCFIKKNKFIKYKHEMKSDMVSRLMNLDDMGILASHYDTKTDGLRIYYANEPLFSTIINNIESISERLEINQKKYDQGLVKVID